MIQKLINGAILALLIFTAIPAYAVDRLVFVTDAFPPYYYEENGITKGFQFKLAALVFQKMRIPIEIKFMPWKRALLTAEALKVDGVFGLRKTDERERWLIYPEEPLMQVRTVIFKRADDDFEYKGLESLAGKTVGIIKGYTYGPEFDETTLFEKEEVTTLKQNFLKLMAGRVDLVAGYRAVGIDTLQKMQIQDKIVICPGEIHVTPLYIGFTIVPGNGKISLEFAKKLKELKESEECKDLMYRLNVPPETITPCREPK